MSFPANQPTSTAAGPSVAEGPLAVQLGRLRLPNPIMVASGTFGYGREMADYVAVGQLGGVVPKTITPLPRRGNHPWRTVETTGGLLNSIGLDNDGVEAFVEKQLPWLVACGAPVVVSVAGGCVKEFVDLAARLDGIPGIAALELNISCPNVSHGVDLASDPEMCRRVVSGVREATSLPVLAKLSPNVTSIVAIARAAADGGADAVTLVNTCLGIVVDWRRRRPMLGNGMGGLSGPAIKPIALRCVYQVRQAVDVPIIGVGGIATLDDVMEFLVTGASAVQIGTASFTEPTVAGQLLEQLPEALAEAGVATVAELIGTLKVKGQPLAPATPTPGEHPSESAS